MSPLNYKGGLILGIILVCANLASSQWQEQPLRCYSCEGNACTSQLTAVNECGGEEKQTCVTVFGDDDDSVIARGCSKQISANHATYCNSNSEKCQSCSSSECNEAMSINDYVTCLTCDSRTDKNCLHNPDLIGTTKQCYKSCMVALYARNQSDASPTYELSRSCLYDKNQAERKICSNGNDPHCKSCQGAKCNSFTLPENRLKCYKCDGDCEDVSSLSEYCDSYNEEDQCYFKFDEHKDVIKLGCRSEFEPEEMIAQIKTKSILLCDEPECNFFDKMPTDYHCKECDSATSEECAVSPKDVTRSEKCSMPYSQCYSMVDEGGKTIRGCLSELPDESFYQCLMNGGKNCNTCTGENCNDEIFPVARHRCHRCSSSENANCQSQPSSSKICSIYDEEDDSCVTKIVKGITYRGCGSELTCGELGSKNCQTCSGADCNTVVLSDNSEGDLGLWQGLPINCYTCHGEQCASSNGQLRKCLDNDNQTCVTVFDQESKVVARGCSDVIAENYANYCDTNPGDCFKCISSGCNVAINKDDYIDCIFCDSKTNENCTFNPLNVSQTRKCLQNCMTALYPRTHDDDPSYDLIRTCLDDKDLDDRDACGSDPLCQRCPDSVCNTHLVPETRHSCNHCQGDSCQIPVAKLCHSYTNHEQCFIKFDEVGAITRMGCKSDYDPSDIQALLVCKQLFLCDRENCNIIENLPSTQTCRLCNSRTDRLCATDPQNIASTISCSKIPITDCYTRILYDGHTERGCLSSLEDTQFLNCYNNNSTECSICNGNSSCNDEVFPSDRLACHTCNSADDSSCEASPVHAEICLNYSTDQTCVTTFDNGVTFRGCSSELSCAPNGTNTCQTCHTSSCNVVNLQRLSDINPGIWQPLPLNCYICSGDDCKASLTRLNMCNGDVDQHCMTVFSENGTVVRRGCSQDVENEFSDYCDRSKRKCLNCNSNGCNNATALEDYIDCIYCDSSSNTNCVQDVKAVSIKRHCNTACMVALRPRSENESSKFELSRSCLDDKDLDDRKLCGSDESLCKSCTSNSCNVEDAVDDRSMCYSCSNGNCNNPAPKKCTTYVKNDSCFILFDENTIEKMGCISEFDENEIENIQDRMIKCSGNNCNDLSLVPTPKTCITCDSSLDIQCASNPKDVTTESNCSSLPNVQCYVRVIYDGTTERGCVSDLSSYRRQACLRGEDKNCSTCIGDGCNSEVFPEDRLSCYKCNSLDDPLCQNKPSPPTVCPVYSETEVCVTKLVNDQTYRGCGSDFTCDDSDKQYCKICNTTKCNTANLYETSIGYPGSWQDLPINCYTCFGSECDSNSTIHLRKCENNNLQNCVTVVSEDGKVMQRSCSDAIYEGTYDSYCDNNPELCPSCKSSGCNNANSLDEYVSCVFCDSATDSNCTSNVAGVSKRRKCRNKCMTSLYPRSQETNSALELSRSCLDDKDLDDRVQCETGNDKFCIACQGENCNTNIIPETRRSCYRCFNEEDCGDAEEMICPAFRENDRCLILFDDSNSVAQMGCESDFDNSILFALRKKIKFCEGDNCNYYDLIPTSHSCLECDSSTDPLCATNPSELMSFNPCTSLPFTDCVTRIEDGHTVRGCISNLEMEDIEKCKADGDEESCKACDSENCNNELYPANRLSCYRCSSNNDEYCQTEPIDPSACVLYQKDDKCVVSIDGNTTYRGCSSEMSCNAADRDTCRICDSKDCNKVDLMSSYVGIPGQWQDLPLNCYVCKGSECENSLGKPQMCENNNLQKCVTVFGTTNKVEERGCGDKVAETHGDYCDTHSGSCLQCKSSGCNDALSMEDYVDCVFCDSTTDPNCVLNPAAGMKTRKCNTKCMVALYPRSSEDDPSFELIRSCLDDKDLDDRNNCADSKDANCKACSGDNCNKFEFPEERHECLSCRGDGCEDPTKQKCVSYHPSDQCYILFDNSSGVIAMGCRSEYEQAAAIELIKSKNLLLCNGSNCNSYAQIPDPQSCIVCNSAIDPQCATNPNLINNYTTCSQLPYTGCYTLVNKDGDTERGCQSALESTSFYGCHTQSDSKCGTCSGNNCNSLVFPEGRTHCQRCNSLDDGQKCVNSPVNSGVCPKYVENQSCVTALKNGVTYRGCSSELSCDVSNTQTCRVCSGSSCNTIDLEYVAKDGEPGRWQDLPIKCHTCKDDSCKNSLGSVEVCQNNNLQNCMTVFNNEGIVVQRGCSEEVLDAQENYCNENRDKCYRCNSNECNKAEKLTDFVECVSCDSSTNSSCAKDPAAITNTRKCYKSCMTALYPRSSEDDPAYDISRSCLDDKELIEQQTCTNGMCKACSGSQCNRDNIPDDRHSCNHCSGESCQMPKPELCAGYRANDQCFLMLDEHGNIVEAGCKSDLTINQTIALIKAKVLLLCEDKNCNDFDKLPPSQTCVICNSKTDLNCAVSPNKVSSSTSCSRLPYTQCYSRVLKDGDTERGCLSNLGEEFYDCLMGNSLTCESCTGEKCNQQTYPSDRRSCHICDSDSDPNCAESPNSPSVCPNYGENDSCVTLFIAGTTYRGCGTDLSCDSSDRKKCRVCNDTDNCNVVNLIQKQDENFGKWQDLPLECYECEKEECNQPLGAPKKCENNNEQDCSTVFDDDGKVTRRGCSDKIDESYCDAHPDLCFGCKSNSCNNATSLNEFSKCVYCDSNKDKNCVTNPISVTKTRQCHGPCMTALYPSDSSTNPAYDLIRTCLNDKESQDQKSCQGPFCHFCSGESCNTHDIPAERLQCFTCLNENCETPVSEPCPLYKKDDKCFIRFDNYNSAAEMGCLSDFRGQELHDILKTKQVYICEGENCNTLDQVPEPQRCATCDSADDVNCAIDPTQIGSVGTCTSMPYPNCYTKIAKGGTTLRGCLADLSPDEFANCILSGGDNCTHCVGPLCNRQIFPQSRLQCYSCDSDVDPDCEELPTKTSFCPYVRDEERCVSALGGNRTERGCSSQLLCDTTDKQTCRHCSFTKCNTLDLANRQEDDNHGMWQVLPLQCHNCTKDNCLHSLGPKIPCVDGDQQDCMTVIDENGLVIRRGCEYDVEDEFDLYCRDKPENCLTCKSNACNDAWELSDYKTCVYCKSDKDVLCTTNPRDGHFSTRKCQKGCMVASFEAANGTTQIIRTCLDDKEIQDQYQCSGEFESNSDCSSCSGEQCNTFKYPKDRLTCNVCHQTNCPSLNEQDCAIYNKKDKCFTKYENGKVELSGCSSDYESSLLENWRELNQLFDCAGDSCNAPEKLPKDQTCVSCDSSKNVACATNPSAITETQNCMAPINSCMMNITNTVTHRGCLNSLSFSQQNVCEESNGSKVCGKCAGEKCNSKIYPSDRRSCHICTSDKDDDCKADPKKLGICPNYSQNNQCVVKYVGSITERGCSTELTCDVTDSDHCRTCDADGCNTVQLDNGVGTIIANNLLLTLLVAIVSLIGVTNKWV